MPIQCQRPGKATARGKISAYRLQTHKVFFISLRPLSVLVHNPNPNAIYNHGTQGKKAIQTNVLSCHFFISPENWLYGFFASLSPRRRRGRENSRGADGHNRSSKNPRINAYPAVMPFALTSSMASLPVMCSMVSSIMVTRLNSLSIAWSR